MKGLADEFKPPNNDKFQMVYAGDPDEPQLQTILQDRMNKIKNRKDSTPVVPAPVINNHISFPPELFGQFPTLPQPHASSTTAASGLLPAGTRLGPEMSITTFCHDNCSRNPAVEVTLSRNNYTSTDAFEYLQVDELKEMGLKGGDIAALRGAVAKWAYRLIA
jgi:hypothetical protein